MKSGPLAFAAVPALLALPTAVALADQPRAAESLLCLGIGLGVALARAGSMLPATPVAQPSRLAWDTGWQGVLGAVLAVSPLWGAPVLVAALGWLLAWRAWLRAGGLLSFRSIAPLLAVALAAFPWILHDANGLGWWFRLTAAAVARGFFGLLGFQPTGEGTALTVQGIDIGVDAACAGMGSLQAMLVAGTIYLTRGPVPSSAWFPRVLALFPLAWFANAARVIALGLAALTGGAEFATGAMHEIIGWTVLLFVYSTCIALLTRRWFAPPPAYRTRHVCPAR